jgi:hypothetical protein
MYLLNHCANMSIDAVELNGDVIDVAKRYFGLDQTEQRFPGRLSLQKADALVALEGRAFETAPERYDAVLVDCFAGAGEVPESCRSRQLAEAAKRVLKPAGVLLQNIWDYSPTRSAVTEEFQTARSTYTQVFDGALEDIKVPMPPRVRWVHVLRATKSGASVVFGPADLAAGVSDITPVLLQTSGASQRTAAVAKTTSEVPEAPLEAPGAGAPALDDPNLKIPEVAAALVKSWISQPFNATGPVAPIFAKTPVVDASLDAADVDDANVLQVAGAAP